ncbi:type-F conjugative transfer system secretin TraK [Accumulibacter sp.]|uniref:TraK domain-containing protein n=1 Tax=Accumulibacter sp. TaxID=2053492 RepID=UPI0035B14B4F
MYPSFVKPATRTRLAQALLLASLASPGVAAQFVEGHPDDGLAATVSRTEPNLIRVDGRRIRRIHGVEGEFAVSADRESGIAYLKPTTEQPRLTVFVADDAGRHWKLLLQVADIPAETLVLRERGRPAAAGRALVADDPRHAAIRRVLVALARDSTPEDMSASERLEIVPLWNESRFVLLRTLDGALRGEKYQLTNVSATRMVLDEREFHRRGVLAVMIDSLELEPGEATQVMVVLEAPDA